jgi:hypothetical protein
MPTMADLASIATAIYDGNPSIGAKRNKSGLTYTSGTASALGFPEPDFFLLSGEEYPSSDYLVYGRGFNATVSYSDTKRKDEGRLQAVCLSD